MAEHSDGRRTTGNSGNHYAMPVHRSDPRRRKRRRKRRRRQDRRLAGSLFVLGLFLGIAISGIWYSLRLPRGEAGGESQMTTPHQETPPPTLSDTQAPVIQADESIQVYAGDTIAYRNLVQVTDDIDPNPGLQIDSSQVDITTPGDYQVTYTATDASGNTARLSITVTVLKKEPGYEEIETIDAMAERLCGQIIEPDMTQREQVKAIYSWARTSFGYTNNSYHSDWRQAAYQMVDQGRGDCFGYYAVTKLMFEYLGIPNIDVRKVKNSENDADHFWSLVSVDGGNTWYHFDATPRVGDGDNFCLVTDAFLDEYSANHKNSHNRDKSLYPPTPEE